MSNEKKKSRGPWGTGIRVGPPGLDMAGVAALLVQNPAAGFRRIQEELIDTGKFRLQDIRDLRQMFNRLADIQVPVQMPVFGEVRTIDSSAFPLLVGNLMVKAMNERHDEIETIGQELVQELDDPKKITVVANITNLDTAGKKGVPEGEDYPMISAGEEKTEIRHRRDGRRIALTMEMIEENDVAGFVELVNALEDFSRDIVEEQTLQRVTDNAGSAAAAAEPYVYRPDGAGAALFSATANTPGTRAPNGTRLTNTALVDITDMEAARSRLFSMLNNRLKRFNVPMSEVIVLVPDALRPTLATIQSSQWVPGVLGENNIWGPAGDYRPRMLSSPKLDDISTTAWYMGRPQKQFRRKWKTRMEYVTLTGNTQRFLEARIGFQARLGWDVEVGAITYEHWIQCLSGVTAPTAV
mgnify:FL=1